MDTHINIYDAPFGGNPAPYGFCYIVGDFNPENYKSVLIKKTVAVVDRKKPNRLVTAKR